VRRIYLSIAPIVAALGIVLSMSLTASAASMRPQQNTVQSTMSLSDSEEICHLEADSPVQAHAGATIYAPAEVTCSPDTVLLSATLTLWRLNSDGSYTNVDSTSEIRTTNHLYIGVQKSCNGSGGISYNTYHSELEVTGYYDGQWKTNIINSDTRNSWC
jgi:hypothetical protein